MRTRAARRARIAAQARIARIKAWDDHDAKTHEFLKDIALDGNLEYLRDMIYPAVIPRSGEIVKRLLEYGFDCGYAAAKNEEDE